jgi:hypothetical protein
LLAQARHIAQQEDAAEFEQESSAPSQVAQPASLLPAECAEEAQPHAGVAGAMVLADVSAASEHSPGGTHEGTEVENSDASSEDSGGHVDVDKVKLAKEHRLPLRGMFKVTDGSFQVVDRETTRQSVLMLCEIRSQIIQEYMTRHELGNWKRKVGEITQKDYETYELPGSALSECHRAFTKRVMPLLQMSYDAGPKKTKFNPRQACAGCWKLVADSN